MSYPIHHKIKQLLLNGWWAANFPDFVPEEIYSPACLFRYPGKLDLSHWLKVQNFREKIDRPLVINNWHSGGKRSAAGIRCRADNDAAYGAVESQHLEGRASDLYVPGWTPEQLFLEAYTFGFQAVFIYDTFVHCDSRFNPFGPQLVIDYRGTHKDRDKRRQRTEISLAGKVLIPDSTR